MNNQSRKGRYNMSIKEKLIATLENAENEEKQLELEFASYNGLSLTVYVVPEVMIQEDEIRITDRDKGVHCQFAIELNDSLCYDDLDMVYQIKVAGGIFSIYLK